ncbi:MAG: hypothetical protein U1D70_03875 [Methylobacter sp.]|nr:hypothetical protein [Methylobacter sp.]MDZ4218143.1 hypothetical protein [Methylobacter sp.]
MRILVILALMLIAILEIGPIPITPVLLIYIVLCRPVWFYACVLRIYGKSPP